MYKLIFATHNDHKLREIKSLMPDDIQIIGLKETSFIGVLTETGDTFSKNAREKCYGVWSVLKEDTFAEDSGLEVLELDNEPGIYSARYAGDEASDEANMDKLLNSMADKADRAATFKTVICLIFNGKQFEFEGEMKGTITTSRSGMGGFGYDPIFMPEGYNNTLAELGEEVKNKISHRAKAVGAMLQYLATRHEGTSMKEQGHYS